MKKISLCAALLIGSGCASVEGKIKKLPTREDPRAYQLTVNGFSPSLVGDLIRAQDDYKREFPYGYFPYGDYGEYSGIDPRSPYAPYARRAIEERNLRQLLDEPSGSTVRAIRLLDQRLKVNEKLDEEQEKVIGGAMDTISDGAAEGEKK